MNPIGEAESVLATEPVVAFDGVGFSYGAGEVLHNLSFTLGTGEIVGLLGPNGAGKSTTIKIIAGILTANSGAVPVAGFPLPERAVDVKQRIGCVPESAALFESLTGQEFADAQLLMKFNSVTVSKRRRLWRNRFGGRWRCAGWPGRRS